MPPVRECVRRRGAPSFLVANKQLHVDGRLVVDAPAHTDCGGIAAEHHARQANVLRHDYVARLQAFDNGKVGAVGAHAHIERRDPKAASRVLGIKRVVAANVTFRFCVLLPAITTATPARRAQSIDSRVTGQASASIKSVLDI